MVEISSFNKKCSLISWFLKPMKRFLMDFTIFFLWPLALPNPNFKCTHLKIHKKTWKQGLDIFLDITSITFKFSANVLFINSDSHGKYYVCVSTGRDATPRVEILMCHPVDADIFEFQNVLTRKCSTIFTKKYLIHRLEFYARQIWDCYPKIMIRWYPGLN